MAAEETPPHMLGPPVEFVAKGGSDSENQANLIQARQSMGIVPAKEVLADAMWRRSNRILLDYTRESVAVRFEIDGVWHPLNPLDRERGDMMLAVLKKITNLNIADRRSKQTGQFAASLNATKITCNFTSQGTKTGERVVIELIPKKRPSISNFEKLGMRERLIEKFKELANQKPGLFVASAPPNRGGLSTTWQSMIGSTDRFMYDCLGIEEASHREAEIENVDVLTYDATQGESTMTLLEGIMLKQPDVLVIPEIADKASLDTVLELIQTENLRIFTSVRAKDSAEAILRLLMLKPDAKQFAEALQCVVNSRLIRKLCSACRQPYQPPPQLLQKLGIPAGKINVLYRQYQPPPPDPENPQQEEPPPCQSCRGMGYRGQTAICEVVVPDDGLRQAIVKRPQLEALRQTAKQAGNHALQEEGILLVAQGVTSINELQRVMK
ncbi:MAG: hypothetical protein CL681_02700 [Blastopirellula sp.]|nr:hypothetical protein [Blastopirellula sp.]